MRYKKDILVKILENTHHTAQPITEKLFLKCMIIRL